MNVVKETAKSKEGALNQVLAKLNAQESEIVYSFNEVKGGLFKGTTYECSGFLKLDVLDDTLGFLKDVLKNMGLNANVEVSSKEGVTTYKIYSDNNPIIIGKDGKNLEALTTIVREYIKSKGASGIKVILDVEDYKDRQIKRLERLARNLAKDVVRTKTDVHMDNMNSYERRVVHNILSDFRGVSTTSEGEEPNRHVVIKYESK